MTQHGTLGADVSRRGRDSGSTLTSSTCEIGARVRVTASTGLMAGQVGTIIKGEGSEYPTVRFKSGQELSFPARKLQLTKRASGDAVVPSDEAYATGAGVKAHEAVATWVDEEGNEHKHTIKDPEAAKLPVLKRNDADWNF